MALEQWEIDLRRQLTEKVNTKPQTWENKLTEEINALPKVVKTKAKDNTTIVMFVLFIVLGCFTLYVYEHKSEGMIQSWISSLFTTNSVEQSPVQPQLQKPSYNTDYDAEIATLRSDIKKIDSENKVNLEKLTSKLKWDSDRITLMGIMLNENFLIVRNNNFKGHLIFFNRDWTLDQAPHYLQLSDDDKDYLRKFIKINQ